MLEVVTQESVRRLSACKAATISSAMLARRKSSIVGNVLPQFGSQAYPTPSGTSRDYDRSPTSPTVPVGSYAQPQPGISISASRVQAARESVASKEFGDSFLVSSVPQIKFISQA